MKIYTRTGDDGTTGLFAGSRVFKDDSRIEACGAVDELNAGLGVCRAELPPDSEIEKVLAGIQHGLFAIGAELATPDPVGHGTALLNDGDVTFLEATIDRFEAGLAPLRQFILPAGTKAAAALHAARSVCRRAERRVVSLARQSAADPASLDPIFDRVLRYLNRVGDLLFVLARAANAVVGQPDVPWRKP